jgi:hypothetical protein
MPRSPRSGCLEARGAFPFPEVANPSQTEPDQAKPNQTKPHKPNQENGLGIPWIPSSESGLFNVLQPIPKKKFFRDFRRSRVFCFREEHIDFHAVRPPDMFPAMVHGALLGGGHEGTNVEHNADLRKTLSPEIFGGTVIPCFLNRLSPTLQSLHSWCSARPYGGFER